MKLLSLAATTISAELFSDKYQITPTTASVKNVNFGHSIELLENDCKACQELWFSFKDSIKKISKQWEPQY